MRRRDSLKSGVALAVAAELGTGKAHAFVPARNWKKYDFGSGPPVTDRLNQGPFPQYPPDAVIPTDELVMATTPSEEVVPNYELWQGDGWVPFGVTTNVYTPLRQAGSLGPFTSTAIEPSALSCCSQAQATGLNTPGRISIWAERFTFPT
jgi:hypothetical protein